VITDAELKKLNAKMGNTRAPEGTVFVCTACSKTSSTRYGGCYEENSPMWDESCMLHALLVRTADILEPEGWEPYERVRRVK